MLIELDKLVADIVPERTILLFGSGSSMPSGAPSVAKLKQHFEKVFGVSASDYTLAEQTGIIEQRTGDRASLIRELRSQFRGINPTGAILNLPLYKWRSLFTTNYERVIEDSYQRRGKPLGVYSSNFDFGSRKEPDSVSLFKLHGTLEKDVSDGHAAPIILTEADYDLTEDYREKLYDRLKSDLDDGHLVIIGHSLADQDVKDVVHRALAINHKSKTGGRITLLLYTRDEGRASLYAARGMDVCFGSIDDFFAKLVGRKFEEPLGAPATDDPLDIVTELRPSTLDAGHAARRDSDVSAMYNGWAASYSDIAAGLTFRRNLADEITQTFVSNDKFTATVLGPCGVGKTTAARQVLTSLMDRRFFGWEHKVDQALQTQAWCKVARLLSETNAHGVLLIDEAHTDLDDINDLIDGLDREGLRNLRLIFVSSSSQWHPRQKTPALFKNNVEHKMVKVQGDEIDRLLALIDTKAELRALVEGSFMGFSRPERRRRLVTRCESDMFVCLKNIFSSEKFDDIVLREYAGLDPGLQQIYRMLAAMEAAGVHVHRQLVIRLLGINPMAISTVLERLTDIIHEETVSEREKIYAWKGRHRVIMGIIAAHKFFDTNSRLDLFAKVIDAISPSYDIEIRTLRELCNVDTGIATIPNKEQQNVLLRKMMSIAPGERVPRHRLIRNLIELNQYDRADTEIRLFQNDFKLDGPATRYKIILATAAAVQSKGLLPEDRVARLHKAAEIASSAASRFRRNKGILSAYCEVGVALAKLTGSAEIFDIAIAALKSAEVEVGDPDITRIIRRIEHRMSRVKMKDDLEEQEPLLDDADT